MLDSIKEFFFGKKKEESKVKPCCPPPKSRLRKDGFCGGCGQHESSHPAYSQADELTDKLQELKNQTQQRSKDEFNHKESSNGGAGTKCCKRH